MLLSSNHRLVGLQPVEPCSEDSPARVAHADVSEAKAHAPTTALPLTFRKSRRVSLRANQGSTGVFLSFSTEPSSSSPAFECETDCSWWQLQGSQHIAAVQPG